MDIFFIFLLGMIGEEVVVEVLWNGVIDYVLKDCSICLILVIEWVLSEVKEYICWCEVECELFRS